MTPSTALSRMRLAGKLCRLGAWIIVAAGLAVIVFYIIITVSSNQENPGQNLNGQLTSYIIGFLMAIPVLFFFLALTAMGALLEYLSTERAPQETSDERVEITSLSDVP